MPDELTAVLSAMASRVEEIRYRAVQRLFELQPQPPPQVLRDILADESWRVRKLGVENILSGEVAAETLHMLVEALEEQENAGLRNSACEVLGRWGTASLEALQKKLHSPSADARKLAADILGEIGQPSAGPWLVELFGDQEENVRAAAVEAVGRLGYEAAVADLLRLLQQDSLLVKMSCLDALDRLRQRVPLERLEPLLAVKPLRPAVYRLLGRLPEAGVLPLLLEGLHSRGRSERAAAVRAIVEHALLCDRQRRVSIQVTIAQLNDEVLNDIRQLLQSGVREEQEAAVILLGWSGRETVIEDLVRLASDATLRELTREAILNIGRKSVGRLEEMLTSTAGEEKVLVLELLGAFASPSSVPLLLQQVLEAEAPVSETAQRELARIAPAEVIPTLVGFLKRNFASESEAVIGALVRLGGRFQQQVLEEVLPLLESTHPELRRAGASIVCQVARREDFQLVLKLAGDADVGVRRSAMAALGRLGKGEAVERLRVALADEAAEVRLAAVQAMARREEPEVVQLLSVALRDENPLVVYEAIVALGRRGTEREARLLRPLVESAEGLLAAAAVKSLVALEPGSKNDWLPKAARHADPEVRRETMAACEKWPAEAIRPLLLQALKDERWEVRLQAARTIAKLGDVDALVVLSQHLGQEPDEWVRQNIKRLLDQTPAASGLD